MANIILRVGDEDKVSYELAAKVAGVSLSEWIRRLANAACGIVTEVQVPITPGVEVEAEHVPAPASENMVPFDPAKGEVTAEPVAGAVSSGKMRAYDPNGGPVTYEPVPGLKDEPKQRAYDPKGGVVRTEPAKSYVRSHSPRCSCLMCTGGKDEKKKPLPAKVVSVQEGEQVYTGETTKFQGRTLYEVENERGKRWTATPPEK